MIPRVQEPGPDERSGLAVEQSFAFVTPIESLWKSLPSLIPNSCRGRKCEPSAFRFEARYPLTIAIEIPAEALC